MASIRKDGRFYTVRWRDLDRRDRQKGRIPTLDDAKAIRRDIESALAHGLPWSGDAGPGPQLQEAVDAYLKDCARFHAASTIARNGGAIARWQDAHPHARLSALDTDAIESWHGDLLIRGCSQNHARNEARALDGLLLWCVSREPYRSHAGDRRPLRMPAAMTRLQPDAPTWGEMDAAIGAARGWYRDLCFVLRCTGLRSQQAMYLTWDHVDLDGAKLTIPPNHPGSKSKTERRGRIVPLAPVLVAELAGWGRREGWLIDRSKRPDKAPAGDPDRRYPLDHEAMRDIWTRAGVKMSARAQPYHAFRKGFISGMTELRVSDEWRRPLVGHSGGVHGDVYTVWRVQEKPLREAVAKVPPIATGRVLSLAADR